MARRRPAAKVRPACIKNSRTLTTHEQPKHSTALVDWKEIPDLTKPRRRLADTGADDAVGTRAGPASCGGARSAFGASAGESPSRHDTHADCPRCAGSGAWHRCRAGPAVNTADSLRGEAAALVRVGGPLTLTALANMGVSITDVIMIGWLGPMLLGAGAAISDLYSIFYYLAAGIASAGAATLASAIGASNHERLRGMFTEVLIATLAAGAVLVPLVWHGAVVLAWLGIEAEVLPDAAGYAHWLAAAMLPMLVVRACIAWFSAVGRTTVVFAFTLSAIPLNVVANGVLMFGWF